MGIKKKHPQGVEQFADSHNTQANATPQDHYSMARETNAPRHSKGELEQMQSLPLRIKVSMTERRIYDWYDHWQGDVYVSFSGGKDSTVLKHIVDNMGLNIPSVFINTGLEFPEIQKFAMSQPNVTTLRPKMMFNEVIKKYGYPLISKEVSQSIMEARSAGENGYMYKKLFGQLQDENGEKSPYCTDKWSWLYDAPFDISHKCCFVMKKNPAKKYEKETNRKPILATMASESRLRYSRWLINGCNAFDTKRPTSTPMAFWTEQDVLHYLKEKNVPYCSVYGDIKIKTGEEDFEGQVTFGDYINDYSNCELETTGVKRTGCMFCMFGCHLEKEPNRFQQIKETHPRQYEYCIGGGEFVDGKWQPNQKGLGIGYVLDYINVKY